MLPGTAARALLHRTLVAAVTAVRHIRALRRRPSRPWPLPRVILAAATALPPLQAHADDDYAPDRMDPTELDSIDVSGRRYNMVGEAISASEGWVGQGDIHDRTARVRRFGATR